MASHMGVQTLATLRNSNVELFIHFILLKFSENLKSNGNIISYKVEQQVRFYSDIANDIWDHKVTLTKNDNKPIELWGQTTCYKGNERGVPEPNKTYEVRETLVEGLCIRQYFDERPLIESRTIHFTVGDPRYTYKWFLDLKTAIFDKSIYIGEPGYDIFHDIYLILENEFTEEGKLQAFDNLLSKNYKITHYVNATISDLTDWFLRNKYRESHLAEKQWGLIKSRISQRATGLNNPSPGLNIKGQVNELVTSINGITTDPLIAETAIILLSKNPFLKVSIQMASNWGVYSDSIYSVANNYTNLLEFIIALWNSPLPERLAIRRILLRLRSDDFISYIQDIGVLGVTEHNLYNGDHSVESTHQICIQILSSLNSMMIFNPLELATIIAKNGRAIVNSARWFEAKNGTELKPSFDYVLLFLIKNGYTTHTPSSCGINTIGYHSELTNETVRPYTNLKVVKDKNGKIVCLIKAKFFREQEFSRRCKEEAFVGLTLAHSYNGVAFNRRFSFPLIMYIDMPLECTPPNYSLNRLIDFGWEIVFNPQELLQKINFPYLR
ncbi:hypothetical protein OHK33_12915 [Pectobacterium aroidearum]|uniref:hypothetical protein n=1 Tax=Pectobacterium aroidearum TaxID=1201031 RepID=UPI003306E696